MTLLIHKVISLWLRAPCVVRDSKIIQFLSYNKIPISSNEFWKGSICSHSSTIIRYYSDKPFISKIKDSTDEGKKTAEKDKKKKALIPKITLLDSNDNLTVTTIQEATKIANRRNMKLLFVRDDPKSGRAEYKMIPSADFVKAQTDMEEESSDKQKTSKKEKLLMISSKIGENDLKSKIKQLSRWLDKKCEARVCITAESNNSANSEEIYKKIEFELKTKGRFVQKRVKNNDLKFQILPPKE